MLPSIFTSKQFKYNDLTLICTATLDYYKSHLNTETHMITFVLTKIKKFTYYVLISTYKKARKVTVLLMSDLLI